MKLAFIGFWILILMSLGLAQANNKDKKIEANFSGNWVLNKSKSQAVSAISAQYADVILTVVHSGVEMKMTTKTTRSGKEVVEEKIYYLDGRDQILSTDKGTKTKVKWNGKKLVVSGISIIRAITIGGRSPSMEIKEEWELSKDGETLSQTVSSTGMPDMMPPTRWTFFFSRVL